MRAGDRAEVGEPPLLVLRLGEPDGGEPLLPRADEVRISNLDSHLAGQSVSRRIERNNSDAILAGREEIEHLLQEAGASIGWRTVDRENIQGQRQESDSACAALPDSRVS